MGMIFGSIIIASGAFSWSVINDMFHFRSFHMFGLLFSAIATAAISLIVIKKWKIRDITKQKIEIKPKPLELKNNAIGGLIFGIGWGITGACTAPIFIILGIKWYIGLSLLSGAIIGVVLYALLRQGFKLKLKLKHESRISKA